jgi:hypothetical protein
MPTAFPNAVDIYRTIANRLGVVYDPTQADVIFAEDVQILRDGINALQQLLIDNPPRDVRDYREGSNTSIPYGTGSVVVDLSVNVDFRIEVEDDIVIDITNLTARTGGTRFRLFLAANGGGSVQIISSESDYPALSQWFSVSPTIDGITDFMMEFEVYDRKIFITLPPTARAF